ncbi:hypothetical protein MMC22_000528 [Lobaria immixta]|nr:hypothetical protein [Lobaria immixta]
MARQSIMSHNAGIKDSALTVHGNLQAERLGRYFAQVGIRFTNIFSSDLQRAFKTAEAIRIAQGTGECQEEVTLQGVSQLAVLREQDFGFYEGKPFYTRQRYSTVSGNVGDQSEHQEDLDFKDVESTDSMTLRMDSFLQDHLLQLLYDQDLNVEQIVAVVSHGVILSHLWRCFLKLFPKGSVALNPNLSVGVKGTPVVLEYLGGWSNTGYLELDILPALADAVAANGSAVTGQQVPQSLSKSLSPRPIPLRMIVKTVNGKEHLKSLKRTGGGVGSSKHDEGQRKIDSFFKKPKLGD